jgi:Ca2+/Na+ antiporter
MDSGAGSLAIGELIGAAFFIVAIVSGCMGIIRPFQSQKITFRRDASFLTGAIMIITWIVYHQRIYWYHSVVLISYYICYVCVVVLGAYTGGNKDPTLSQNECKKDDTVVDESTHLLYQAGLFILCIFQFLSIKDFLLKKTCEIHNRKFTTKTIDSQDRFFVHAIQFVRFLKSTASRTYYSTDITQFISCFNVL